MIPKKESDKAYKNNIVGKEAKIEIKDKVFEGKIILETKNMIQIKTAKGKKKIIKKNAVITINNIRIKGEKITKRTEDRIKAR
jgi:RNase P/RNase MRP subunit p29